MKLTINNKTHSITPISQLSVAEFLRIVVKGKVATLPEYIAIITDEQVEEIMKSQLEAASAPFIHQSVFDVAVEKELKQHKDAIMLKDEIHLMRDLTLKSFGKSYFFDLYLQQFIEKKINEYELCVYTLAIALCDELSDKVEQTYQQLIKMNWRKVLPQAFFFGQKVQESETNFDKAIESLYVGIKKDQFQDPILSTSLKKYGKELTSQLLCKKLNLSINELMNLDANFAKRQLFAYHVENAYSLKRNQSVKRT